MKKAAGGGDMTLESRHLVGLFLGVVVLCGVFFTLGYVMGHAQPESSVMAAGLKEAAPTSPPVSDAAAKPGADAAAKSLVPAPAASDWHFPSTAEPGKPAEKLETAKPSVALNPPSNPGTAAARPPAVGSAPASKAPEVAAGKPKLPPPPRIAKGAILLQVAALSRESDALVLAEALQRKNFPAFIATPAGSNLYRVQVGPYADKESAELAQKALHREGFKAIVKR